MVILAAIMANEEDDDLEEEDMGVVKWLIHLIHADGSVTEHAVEPGQSLELPASAVHVLVPATASGQPVQVTDEGEEAELAAPLPEETPEPAPGTPATAPAPAESTTPPADTASAAP